MYKFHDVRVQRCINWPGASKPKNELSMRTPKSSASASWHVWIASKRGAPSVPLMHTLPWNYCRASNLADGHHCRNLDVCFFSKKNVGNPSTHFQGAETEEPMQFIIIIILPFLPLLVCREFRHTALEPPCSDPSTLSIKLSRLCTPSFTLGATLSFQGWAARLRSPSVSHLCWPMRQSCSRETVPQM